MQSMSVFLDITKVADLRGKKADASRFSICKLQYLIYWDFLQ